jgi:hypothetical protein
MRVLARSTCPFTSVTVPRVARGVYLPTMLLSSQWCRETKPCRSIRHQQHSSRLSTVRLYRPAVHWPSGYTEQPCTHADIDKLVPCIRSIMWPPCSSGNLLSLEVTRGLDPHCYTPLHCMHSWPWLPMAMTTTTLSDTALLLITRGLRWTCTGTISATCNNITWDVSTKGSQCAHVPGPSWCRAWTPGCESPQPPYGQGFAFLSSLGSKMVLQQAPAKAAVCVRPTRMRSCPLPKCCVASLVS